MGDDQIKNVYSWAIAVVVPVVCYLEFICELPRRVIGIQPDVLPAVLTWGWLVLGPFSITLLAFWAALCFSGISQNPFLVTFLPIAVFGLWIYRQRGVLLIRNSVTQIVVSGVGAGVVTLGQYILLILSGVKMDVGASLIYQVIVNVVFCAVMGPIFCVFFQYLGIVLVPRKSGPGSFRPDCEIRRGRIFVK